VKNKRSKKEEEERKREKTGEKKEGGSHESSLLLCIYGLGIIQQICVSMNAKHPQLLCPIEEMYHEV
jgi:hypothetical protein